MKNKTLFSLMVLFVTSMSVNAQTTGGDDPLISGSCASYIQFNEATSLQADSIYKINKTTHDITVDAVAEEAWAGAYPRVISKIQRMPNDYTNILNLDTYPQTEAYGHATFRALWTDNGVYMFITVKDNAVRYQNPSSPWENDAIEFYFSKIRGSGNKQVIIPAMVGTTNLTLYNEPLTFESGSAVGSDTSYEVYGYDNKYWDETTFYWAIKKTDVGFDMEVYMDKDIVTNGNSDTNYGLNKMFCGDIAYDIAGDTQNAGTPPLYIREGALNMLGNSCNNYTESANYGYFKMVDEVNGISIPKDAKFSAIYNSDSKEIKISSSVVIYSIEVYSVAGQVMPANYNNASVSVSGLKQGVYFVNAKDLSGNSLGVHKIVIY